MSALSRIASVAVGVALVANVAAAGVVAARSAPPPAVPTAAAVAAANGPKLGGHQTATDSAYFPGVGAQPAGGAARSGLVAALSLPAVSGGTAQPAVVASISGTVKDTFGTPLSGIAVALIGATAAQTTTTAPDGTYSFGAATGSYIVEFNGNPFVEAYAAGFYSRAGFTVDPNEATRVRVASSSLTGIDVALPGTTVIFGYVKASGVGVAGLWVEGWLDGVYYGFGYTDTDGSFAVPMTAGDGSILIYDPTGKYSGGWYTGSGLSLDVNQAVTYNMAGDIGPINISLSLAKHIKGKVTVAGVGAADIVVDAVVNGFGSTFA
jgi:hypothetical protein